MTENQPEPPNWETLRAKFEELNRKGQRQMTDGTPAHVVYQTLLETQEMQRRVQAAYYAFTRN